MSSCRRVLLTCLLVGLVSSAIFAAGLGVGRYIFPAPASSVHTLAERHAEQFRVFWEAWRVIESRFYTDRPLDYQQMTYGAIRGMVSSLGDPHTTFLTPAQLEMFSKDLEGSFGGIGVTISMTEEGYLQVVRLIPGGPAEQTPLQAGDLILEVDGTSVLGMDMAQAVTLIRGPVGTEVRLLVRRPDGHSFEITIRRALIQIPTIESRMLDQGIAYVRLAEFNGRAAALVRSALQELLQQNPRALILDLRGNPGGYLHIVVEIADGFLPKGLIVIERSSDGDEIRHEAKPGELAEEIPLVVLVDRGSASASEILGGAIQDNGRGILIGERTYGKGSVQITERLSDKSGVQVTIRRWYTPADRQIDGQGLTPDIEVKPTDEDREAQRDPQLERAISYLLERTP